VVVLLSGGVIVEVVCPRAVIPAYRHVNRTVLGLLFWIGALFAMAVAHVLTVRLSRAAAAGVIVAAIGLRWNSRRRLPGLPTFPCWGVNALPLAAIVLVLGSLFMMGMRPGVAWDAGTYHLTVPRLYLEHGGFRPIQFNVYSNWPLNEELLFALGLALHDYFLATLVQWVFAGLIVWALIKGSQVHGHRAAGPIAACLFLANDVVLYESGVAYVDLGLSFFFLMALLYALHARAVPEERTRALVLAGTCCGLMAGVKWIGLFGIGSVGAVVLWDAVRLRGVARGTRESLVYVALPCLLLVLPWCLKSAWYTGNPIYPFFWEQLRGAEWTRSLGDQFGAWQSAMGMGRSAIDYLRLPVRLALEGGPGYYRFDGRISWTWLVCVPLIGLGCWGNAVVRRGATAAFLYFACWSVTSQQARFVIPALAVLAFVTALAVTDWVSAIPRAILRIPALATTSTLAAALLLSTANDTIDEAGRWWYRYKVRDLATVLRDGVPPIFQFINDSLPMDAKLLFLDTNQGFFCHREYVADSFFEASQVNTFLLRNRRADEIEQALVAAGFTHVLDGHDRWNIRYPPTLEPFLTERARLVYTSPQGDRLYEILRLQMPSPRGTSTARTESPPLVLSR
jgi:hypothetical protein